MVQKHHLQKRSKSTTTSTVGEEKESMGAVSQLGQMYLEGTGVKQSYVMARMLYELAAQQGYVSAIYNLGVMYDNKSRC